MKITAEKLRNDSIDALLEEIISPQYLQTGEHIYPIIEKRKKGENSFKINYIEFWNALISSISDAILYDGFFMETLILWIFAFANSSARPFRHTSILAAVEILKSLIKIANRLSSEFDNNQRLLKAEKKKSSSKVGQLTEKLGKYQKKIANIEEMMSKLFQKYLTSSSDWFNLCL